MIHILAMCAGFSAGTPVGTDTLCLRMGKSHINRKI